MWACGRNIDGELAFGINSSKEGEIPKKWGRFKEAWCNSYKVDCSGRGVKADSAMKDRLAKNKLKKILIKKYFIIYKRL